MELLNLYKKQLVNSIDVVESIKFLISYSIRRKICNTKYSASSITAQIELHFYEEY